MHRGTSRWCWSAIAAGAFVLILVPGVVQAQPFDRPDILDVGDAASSLESGFAIQTTTPVNGVEVLADVSSGNASRNILGAVGYFESPVGNSQFRWDLYEPDKVKRKERSLLLKQKNYVFLQVDVDTADTDFLLSGVVNGCKAQVSVKDDTGDQVGDTAKWKMTCSADALDQLGLNGVQKTAFLNAFGMAVPAHQGTGTPP